MHDDTGAVSWSIVARLDCNVMLSFMLTLQCSSAAICQAYAKHDHQICSALYFAMQLDAIIELNLIGLLESKHC